MARLLSLLSLLFIACTAQEVLKDLPMDPCLNGGILVNGVCECSLKYEGERCEQERCLNGGRRQSIRGGKVTCRCPFGLEGDRCEKVTYCEEGKGKLVNGKCVCSGKYSGLFCQVRTCYNGVPTGGLDGLCLCDIGFTGPFCDEKLVCENDGFVNSENECSCRPGYEGDRCERCSPGYVKEGRFCIQEVSESSLLTHTAGFTDQPYAWPIFALAAGAAIIVAVLAFAATQLLRKWNAKPSRTSSVQGSRDATDV